MTANRAFEDLTNSYLDLRWQFDPVPCYAVGRRQIADYSLRDCHDAVLGYGGLPVSLVRWGMGLSG